MTAARICSLRMAALCLGLSACGGPGVPTWAVDTMTIGPDTNGLLAIQRWDVFDEPWLDHPWPRYHLCGALVDLQPRERALDCPECLQAWDLDPVLLETDCPETWPTLVNLTAVGIGQASTDANSSFRGWIQVEGGEWWHHGDALEERADGANATSTWTIMAQSMWSLASEPTLNQP